MALFKVQSNGKLEKLYFEEAEPLEAMSYQELVSILGEPDIYETRQGYKTRWFCKVEGHLCEISCFKLKVRKSKVFDSQ